MRGLLRHSAGRDTPSEPVAAATQRWRRRGPVISSFHGLGPLLRFSSGLASRFRDLSVSDAAKSRGIGGVLQWGSDGACGHIGWVETLFHFPKAVVVLVTIARTGRLNCNSMLVRRSNEPRFARPFLSRTRFSSTPPLIHPPGIPGGQPFDSAVRTPHIPFGLADRRKIERRRPLGP